MNSNASHKVVFTPVNDIHFALYSLVIILGVGGNILVVRWFAFGNRRNSPGSIMVICLACNDCLSSVIVPLFRIHDIVAFQKQPQLAWYLGEALCYALPGLLRFFLLATSWILVAIAFERYRYVRHLKIMY